MIKLTQLIKELMVNKPNAFKLVYDGGTGNIYVSINNNIYKNIIVNTDDLADAYQNEEKFLIANNYAPDAAYNSPELEQEYNEWVIETEELNDILQQQYGVKIEEEEEDFKYYILISKIFNFKQIYKELSDKFRWND